MAVIKNWDDTYKYWLALDVPDVEFLTFDLEIHNPYFEWYDKKEKRQLRYNDNPIKQTAFHLGSYLKGKEKELISAYKLFSIIKYSDHYEFTDKIEHCFLRYKEDMYGWWSPNSKKLFPYFEGINDFELRGGRRYSVEWKALIDAAAKFWTEIANSLSIIIIPELMEYNSTERKAFDDYNNKREEQREYQQYLRLKEKFEKK